MIGRRRTLAGIAAVVGGIAGTALLGGHDPGSTRYDWPMARYDAARMGYNPDASGPKDDVEVAWKREIDGRVPGSRPPILVGDTLYVASDAELLAIDRETGATEFTRRGQYSSAPARANAPVYRRDMLAVRGSEGIYGLSAGGGHGAFGLDVGFERWHAPGDSSSSLWGRSTDRPGPVAVDDTVYATVPNADRVLAVDATSGSIRWARSVDDGSNAEPMGVAVRDGTLFAIGVARTVTAFDAETGDRRWQADLQESLELFDPRPPTATEAGIVVPGRTGVVLLDADEGSTVWVYEHGGNVTDGCAAVAEGRVFVSDGDGEFHAIDLDTGETLWTIEYGPQIEPVVADGVVYLAYDWLDELLAVDAETGDRRWTVELAHGVSQPIVDDGRLYAVDSSGVFALEAAR